jgi:AAA lid domain
MATHEQLILPAGLERRSRPWLSSARTRDDWGNARSMRPFVEPVREAQAERLAIEPGGDLTEVAIADIDQAPEIMEMSV